MLLAATPGWVSLPVVVCFSPPLLAGACCRRWCVVCGVWCVVCGVRRWCVGGVVAGVWCDWSVATPGGGSCVLLPATPGWVSLPVVVGGPRHSWLGSAGGSGVWCVVCGVWCVVCGVWCAAVVCWWGCGWCVAWLVPRNSRWRFLCATPRHSWLGFAAGGGGRSSPLLAEGPGRGSPPLLAGFRCRRWCVVCGVWCVACGVRRWRVWWVCGWCVVWLVPRHSWRRFLCATPRHSWLGFAAGGGGRSSPLLAEGPGRGSPPLLAGFRCRRWCVVCGVWCVACGVRRWRMWWVCGWCVVWLVPRHSWRRFLCATPRHSWLGFAAGGGVGLPATPGSGPPVVVVCFAGGVVLCCVCLWCVWVCAVAVLCCVLRVCGVCFFGGVVWWCGGCVFRVPFSLVLMCVCALCGPSCWCGWRGGGWVGLGWVKASSGPPGPRTSPLPARHNWSGGCSVVRSQGLPD